MKLPHSVFSAFVGLILCAGMARANPVNNLELSVNSLSGCLGGSFCFGWDPTASAIGFTISSSSGTYQLYAVNTGGLPYRNLEITSLLLVISATGIDITCASNIFANCSVTDHPHGTWVSFSDGRILPGQYFSLNFGCSSGTCSWPAGTSVTAFSGTNVPEPGSMALILTGIGAILTRRELWKTGS